MTSIICTRCRDYLAEYSSPANLCRYCWIDWWLRRWKIANKQDRIALEREKKAFLDEESQIYGEPVLVKSASLDTLDSLLIWLILLLVGIGLVVYLVISSIKVILG